MDLFEQVSEDIKNAMKAKDKVALETLRNVKKFFLEAKTAPGANDTLMDADALKIMQKLVKQGKDSATIYVQQGRQDLADVELEQVKVIEKYLPQQMSAEELEKELKAIIAQVGAAGPKDMGKVMGVASKKLAGLAEGPVEDRAADAARHGHLAHAAAAEELADARSGIGGGSIVEGLADVVQLNLVIFEGLGHEDRLVRIHSDHQFLSVYF